MHPMPSNSNPPSRPGTQTCIQPGVSVVWSKSDSVHPAGIGNQPGCKGTEVQGDAGQVDGAGALGAGNQEAGKAGCMGCGACKQEGVRV